MYLIKEINATLIVGTTVLKKNLLYHFVEDSLFYKYLWVINVFNCKMFLYLCLQLMFSDDFYSTVLLVFMLSICLITLDFKRH